MLRPEQRLGDLVVGLFNPDLRQRRADVPAMLPHLVAGDAGECVPGEDAGTVGGTRPLSPGLGRQRRHDRGVVRWHTRRRPLRCCGGSLPRLHARKRPGILAIELRGHPLKPHDVVTEPILGVELGVVEDSEGTRKATLLHDLQQLHVLLPRADRGDLQATGLAVGKHPVEVEHLKMGLHPRKHFAESPGMDMAVMLVVDNADIRDRSVAGTQRLNDLDLILRLAEPTAMVVEADSAGNLFGGLGDWPDPRRFGCHASLLLVGIGRRAPAPAHPQARRHAVALEDAENQLRLVIELARKPPGDKLDPLRGNSPHLVVELRNMLRPVVVGVFDDPQPLHHRRPIGRRSGLVIERHDAPGDEIVPAEELLGRHQLVGSRHGRRAHGQREENNEETKRSMNADHGESPKVK